MNSQITKKKKKTGSILQRGPLNSPFIGLLPDSLCMDMVYSGYTALAPGASYGNQLFRGNSVYDPDGTGTGAQPPTFDAMMLLYTKYCVLESWIDIKCWNANASSATMAVVGLYPRPETATSATNWNNFLSQKNVQWTILPNATRGGIARLRGHATTSQMLGKKDAYDEDDCSGTSSTNPNLVWVWDIAAADPDGSASVICDITFQVKYRVLLMERKTVPLS